MDTKFDVSRREFLKDSALGGVSWAALGTSGGVSRPPTEKEPSKGLANDQTEEPSYELAVAEWPDLTRPITFLGCKDHLDEFGVMWNGNLTLQTVTLCDADRRLVKTRPDPSLQVSFALGERPDFGNIGTDDGSTIPSLRGGFLPMAQVRIRRAGVTVLQEAFVASDAATCQVSEWNSPVFLHLRFTVEDPGAGDSPIRLWAQFAKNHITYAMREVSNVRISLIAPLYPGGLRAQGDNLEDSRGRTVMFAGQGFTFHSELPNALNSIALHEWQLDKNLCEFTLPRQAGAAVEMTLPYLPALPEEISAMRGRTFARMQDSVQQSWKAELGRGMRVNVPEEPLNNLWRFAVPLTFMTADRYPNGDRALKISSHWYEAIWTTPTAINIVDLIQRGYFQEAVAYLDPLLRSERQQPVPNTGSSFSSTNGCIGAPRDYLAINWISDNGAALWAASEYFLVSRDHTFLDRWLPTMLASLEWIARERQRTKLRAGLDAGLMPAGRFSDQNTQGNFFINDAWTFRGLSGVCRVLEVIGHKEAARWAAERDDYRTVFRRIFHGQVERTMRWRDPSGEWIPFIPLELNQMSDENLTYFYVDSGPMALGAFGLIDPNDETMTWAMRWLTEGPDSKTGNPDWFSWNHRPSLRFEMSSLEPCYSWNIYLRFFRNERQKFLEGFYSMAAGSVSRKFLGGVEHRNGIQAVPATNAVLDNHLRNMLLIENFEQKGLELLRNSPGVWLRPGQEVRVQQAPTYFGSISYMLRAVSADQVTVQIDGPNRESLAWLRLHLCHPDRKPLRAVRVNNVSVRPLNSEVVEIKNPSRTLKVEADF